MKDVQENVFFQLMESSVSPPADSKMILKFTDSETKR